MVTDVAEEFAASIFRLLVVLEARIYFGIEISVSCNCEYESYGIREFDVI
jgi:hypothetical protein